MIRHAWTTLRITFRHWPWPLLAIIQAVLVLCPCAVAELEPLQATGWMVVCFSIIATTNALGTLWRDRLQAVPALPLSPRSRALGEAAGGLLLPVSVAVGFLAWREPEYLGVLLPLLPSVFAITLLRHLVRSLSSLSIALVPALALLLALLAPWGPLVGVAAIVLVHTLGRPLVRRTEGLRLPVRAGPRHRALSGPLDELVSGWFRGAGFTLVVLSPVYAVVVAIDLAMALPGLLVLVLVAVVAGPHLRPAGLPPASEGPPTPERWSSCPSRSTASPCAPGAQAWSPTSWC